MFARITLKPYIMKRILFTAFAVIVFSGVSFAKKNDTTIKSDVKIDKSELLSNNTKGEDATYWCYEAGRSETTNPMNGETTVTIRYRCIKF
jgi:hypothetical protein